MDAAIQKIAIVLHAPPATEKTQTCESIQCKLPGARRISLDSNWSPGQSRYQGGEDRYRDLSEATRAERLGRLCNELARARPSDVGLSSKREASRLIEIGT